MMYELIAPCHFGMEAVLKREIIDLGYDIVKVEDGKVHFWGDEDAICRANVFLRTPERILIKCAEFYARSFEELFDETEKLTGHSLFQRMVSFGLQRPQALIVNYFHRQIFSQS